MKAWMRGCGFVLLAGLTACTQVSFQSAPEPLAGCDPRLQGDWEALSEQADRTERVFLRIEAQCTRWLALELDLDDEPVSPKLEDLAATRQLRFAGLPPAAAGDDASPDTAILVVTEPAEATDPESAAAEPAAAPSGHLLLQYDLDGERLRVRQLDPRRVAHRIIDDELPGWVDKHDRRADGSGNLLDQRFRVHVFGDAAVTAAVVDEPTNWETKPWLVMQRVVDPAEAQRLEGWYQQARSSADQESD